MTSPIAGLPLHYLIGISADNGFAKTLTELGYDCTTKTAAGVAVAYVNCRQESGGRKPGVEYIDPPDDIEQEYGEPAFKFGTNDFWTNLTTQFTKWQNLKYDYIEIDNLDTYSVNEALSMLDNASLYNFKVLIKNPTFVEGDNKRLIQHMACVGMICEQDDDENAHTLDDFRKAAGLKDLPIRVVTYGDQRPWAVELANGASKMVDFGVTYSKTGEYQSVEHLLRPSNMPTVPTEPVLSPTPWVAIIKNDIGRYHDSDAPLLAQEVGRIFPAHAAYAAVAGPSTAWCGIYCANKLSKFGIEPPYNGEPGVESWMYVDSWKKLKGGTIIPFAQKRDGDLALWITPGLHHISFCIGNKYIGGNQSNSVTEASFPTPSFIVRPPDPKNYVPTPESMPLLMIESSGDAVRYLQTMLNEQNNAGLTIDGDFGELTETAVKQYQAKWQLEVDGIVGPQTWGKLMEGGVVPEPIETTLLTTDQVIHIMDMAKNSAIAKYSWKSRGVAPIGYTQGIATMYAQCALKLEANDSAVMAMTNTIGSNSKDALSYYGVTATGRANILRKCFVMLLGLGMRESSGNYTEGRDTTASNVTADTAEAGLFQQSWNSSNSSSEMKKLLPAYQNEPDHPCFINVFKIGITPKVTKSYGSGPGYDFQELAKSCPAFATEMAAVGIRVLYNHWGPIVRQEVEMRTEAEALFAQIDGYLADRPPILPPVDPDLPPPVEEVIDVAKAKAECMAAVEEAIDKLIADIVKQTTTTTRPRVLARKPAPEPDVKIEDQQPVVSTTGVIGDTLKEVAKGAIQDLPIMNKSDEELQAIGSAMFDALLRKLAALKQKET